MMARELTARQEREIAVALRHLGRAMRAMSRANLPLDPETDGTESLVWELIRAERQIGQASDRMIDALEARCVAISDEDYRDFA